jgi:hypothetical protein
MASTAFTVQDFVRLGPLHRTVKHSLQDDLSTLYVTREDLVDRLAVHPLVLHRNLARQQDAHNRFATATTRATGLMKQDVFATRRPDVFPKLIKHFAASCSVLARGRAHLNVNVIGRRSTPSRLARSAEEFLIIV